jgi:CSLREA domain-containing protein
VLVLACIVLALCPTLGESLPVTAASLTFAVTTTADGPDASPGDGLCATSANQCSVRAAVQEADAQPHGASSIITVPTGTYTLSLGALVISNTVAISGAGSGAAHLLGQGDRVLVVAAGTRAVVSGVTLAGGNAGTSVGGGILNLGVLVLSQSSLSDNMATNGGGLYNGPAAWLAVVASTVQGNVGTTAGGGLANNGGTVTVYRTAVLSNTGGFNVYGGGGIENSGTLTVTNSTLSGNSAGEGGGISNLGTLTVTNSTLSGNSANGYAGGGIFNFGTLTMANSTLSGNAAGIGGGVLNFGPLTVSNSTLSGNSGAMFGGGVANYLGPLTVSNSTLSGNSATFGGGIYSQSNATTTVTGTIVASGTGGADCAGTLGEVQGYNLDDDTSCGFSKTTDLTNTNPLLGPLQNNGGPTPTMALLPGSPAIDKGGTAANGCPATDQRGVARPQGPACDIGAFELVP